MGQRSLAGYRPLGCKQSYMTEVTWYTHERYLLREEDPGQREPPEAALEASGRRHSPRASLHILLGLNFPICYLGRG